MRTLHADMRETTAAYLHQGLRSVRKDEEDDDPCPCDADWSPACTAQHNQPSIQHASNPLQRPVVWDYLGKLVDQQEVWDRLVGYRAKAPRKMVRVYTPTLTTT